MFRTETKLNFISDFVIFLVQFLTDFFHVFIFLHFEYFLVFFLDFSSFFSHLEMETSRSGQAPTKMRNLGPFLSGQHFDIVVTSHQCSSFSSFQITRNNEIWHIDSLGKDYAEVRIYLHSIARVRCAQIFYGIQLLFCHLQQQGSYKNSGTECKFALLSWLLITWCSDAQCGFWLVIGK